MIVEGLVGIVNVGVTDPGPPVTVKAGLVEQSNITIPELGVTVPTSVNVEEHGVNVNGTAGTTIWDRVCMKGENAQTMPTPDARTINPRETTTTDLGG